jgi:hypothetical protein
MANPQLLSGARGQIYNGTTLLAVATDITVNVRHNVRPTYVIGDENAKAIDSLAYDVDVSIGRVIPVNVSDPQVASVTAGVVKGTNAEISSISLGLEAVLNTITSATDINIVLQDRVTGATIANVQGCRFSGRTQSMNSNDIANERINFVGIYDAGYAAKGKDPANTATGGYGL